MPRGCLLGGTQLGELWALPGLGPGALARCSRRSADVEPEPAPCPLLGTHAAGGNGAWLQALIGKAEAELTQGSLQNPMAGILDHPPKSLARAQPAGPAASQAAALDVRAHSLASPCTTQAHTSLQLLHMLRSGRAQRALPAAPTHGSLQVPSPPAMREAQSQTQPRANTKSRLSALPFCVGVHLVTEPPDAFPVFLRGTWVSGFILHRKKKSKVERASCK